MKFVGVREFKQHAVKYLNAGNEIVVMKRKKLIARLTPIQENTPEAILLDHLAEDPTGGIEKNPNVLKKILSLSPNADKDELRGPGLSKFSPLFIDKFRSGIV